MRETVNPIEGVYIKNCGPLIPGNEITGWLGGIRPGRKKNWYRVTPLLSFIAVTKVTSNTRTRKEHLFAEERIYHINYGVLQGFPALRKAVTTNVKKYNIFWRVFDIANQLLNVTRFYSVRLINERESLHHSLSKIVCWNVFGLWLKNTRITLSLTDSDVRTFLEGEEEKPKVTYSVALVLAFLAAENENRQLEDLPQADFCCVPWRFLLSVFILYWWRLIPLRSPLKPWDPLKSTDLPSTPLPPFTGTKWWLFSYVLPETQLFFVISSGVRCSSELTSLKALMGPMGRFWFFKLLSLLQITLSLFFVVTYIFT